jgi:O-antigen/teichoic acid export membrane protein
LKTLNQEIDRNQILKKNISWGFIFKVSGMALSYISIPIVLNYLGEKNYGVWITLFSILSWIYTFDVGVGNGLKIRLTEALSNKDDLLAKEYVSTAYILIFFISIILVLMGTIGIYSVTFSKYLDIDFLTEGYLQQVILISFIFTISNFVIGLYKQLLFSVHQSAFIALTNILLQSIVIISLLFAGHYFESSLLLVAFIYGIANLITGIVFSFLFFRKRTYLLPKLRHFNRCRVRDIAGLGIDFFIIQLSVIVIFTTDNLIITKLLGAESVTSYSVVYQLFQVFIVLWYIISAPLTPLYTDAYIKNDIHWIKNTIKRLNKLFVVIVVAVGIAVVVGEFVIGIWLGRILEFPNYLFLFFGVFVLIRIYGDLYMSFLNAIGKLKWQLYLSVFGALINIPLSILFVNTFNLGSSGVILATCVSLILLSILMPLQTYLELNKKSNV